MSDGVFFAARDRFLASLPEQDRLLFCPCAGREDLLLGLEKIECIAKKFRRRRGMLGVLDLVDSFGKRLEPFCKVIDTLITSKPEISALVWGCLRLILQLASHYGGFFNRTVKVLGRLGETFPQYAAITDLPHLSTSKKLRDSVEAVYVDLFEFFSGIAAVFVKKDTRIKSTVSVVSSIIWRPFDARLADLLDRITFHQQLVRDELNIAQARAIGNLVEVAKQEKLLEEKKRQDDERTQKQVEEIGKLTNDIIKAMEQKHEEDTVSRIQQWLAPPAFASTLENNLRLIKEDTGAWFLNDQRFKKWYHSKPPIQLGNRSKCFDSRTFWVHGNPGCGKTVLASTVIDEMTSIIRSNSEQPRSELAYYFFRFDSAHNNSTSALSAIMAQLLQMNRHNRALLDACTFVMQYSSHGQSTATYNELIDLILTHMHASYITYIVLDGVDEAEDDKEIIQTLRSLASAPSCRFLLFGRPTVAPLQKAVLKEAQFGISKASIEGDIKIYLRHEVDEFVADDLLPDYSDAHELTDQLCTGADGMFLWARLMMSYLASPAFEPFQRLRIIQSVTFPEGLDSMYNRIINLILQRNREERDLATRILLWLTYSLTHLDTPQLRETIIMAQNSKNDKEEALQDYGPFEQTVIWACAGLVERYRGGTVNDKPFNGFRFIHLTVQEYFSKESVAKYSMQRISIPIRQLIPVASVAHLEIARSCIHYLTYYVPAQPFSGDTASDANLLAFRQAFPFAFYAAPFWIRHLQAFFKSLDNMTVETEPSFLTSLLGLTASLQGFLGKPLLIQSWIEAHYMSMKLFIAENPSAEVLHLCPTTATLSNWAHWLACNYGPNSRNTSVSNVSGSEGFSKLGELCDDLTNFDSDMQELQLHWSDNLMDTPGIIRSEVAAFSSSKFLPQTMDTKTTSLAPKELESSRISTKPLCTISDVATDGNLMAVLSIWTSRVFEETWNNLTQQSTCDVLKVTYHEWMAQYQLWNIEGEPCQVVDIRIPLKHQEIWLQIRQSLRFEFGAGWKLSFPLAISKNCLRFTVLRTVFRLKSASQVCHAELQSITFTMGDSVCLQNIWSNARSGLKPFPCSQGLLPPDLQRYQNSWYTYSMCFSPNGRYIFFTDFEFNMQTHLIIWELVEGEKLDSRPVAFAYHNIQQNIPVKHVAFHASEPLVIFCDGSNLYRWTFLEERPVRISLIMCDIDRFSISNDAVYAIVGNTVVSLYPAGISRPPTRLAIEPRPCEALTTIMDQDKQHITALKFQPGRIFRGTVSNDLNSGSISLRVDSAVTLEASALGSEQMLKLLALPQWPGLEQTFAVLRLPEQGERMFKILLNQAACTGYDMSKQAERKFPLVIDRHLNAIRKPVKTGNRLEFVRDMGEIKRPDSPDSGRERNGSQNSLDRLRITGKDKMAYTQSENQLTNPYRGRRRRS